MSLGDSLWPDRAPGQQQDALRPALGAKPVQTPTEALFARTDARVDAEFVGIFGADGPDVRAALEGAAAEDPSAYDRFRVEPDAFGTVVGNRERADTVGGALEALNYSKAYHAAEQAGETPSVPGYGAVREESANRVELSQDLGLQDGIYLDREGNQIGHLGSGSTRLFVVTNPDDVQAMAASQSAGAGTEPLRNQIGSALEIPSLDAFRAMHADIVSQDWQTREVSGLWGLDCSGASTIAFGGIGEPLRLGDSSYRGASASPGRPRTPGSDTPLSILQGAGFSFQGTYHSHPNRDGRNNVSSVQETNRNPGGDRQLAGKLNRAVSENGSNPGRSVNILMNPERGGMTVIYTSTRGIMSVNTDSLIGWRLSNNIIIK